MNLFSLWVTHSIFKLLRRPIKMVFYILPETKSCQTETKACQTEYTTEPITEEPITEPVAEEPITEPVADEPITEPVAEEPIPEEPITEPVAEEPVAEEPVTEEPTIEVNLETIPKSDSNTSIDEWYIPN
jgi:hypothetical protein